MSGSVRMAVSRSDSATYSTINWYFYAKGNGVSWNSSASYSISGAASKSGSFNLRADTTERLVASGSFTVTRTKSAQSKTIKGTLTTDTSDFGTQSASGSTTVPALASYTVTLNNNGSTSTVTKWYNESVTLPTPTRTNYTFKGWQASNGTIYQGTYTGNAAITLTALWELDKRPPAINSVTAERVSSSNSKNLKITVNFTKGDNRNLSSVIIKYRILGSSSAYTTLTTFTNVSSSPVTYTSTNGAFSESSAYEIVVTIADEYFSGLESYAQVSKYGYIWKAKGVSSGTNSFDLNAAVSVNGLTINSIDYTITTAEYNELISLLGG